MAAALTGFYDLTGWADRSPAGPYLAYTDAVSPRFMLVSLLAALEHRRKSGEGQHIDLSQAEAAIHMLAPALLDHELNGHVWSRMGNRDLALCPHGVYPARSAGKEEVWLAIACQSDAAWLSLCQVLDRPDLRDDAQLRSVAGRRAREDELEGVIAAWTQTRAAQAAQDEMIQAGVAAHVVQNSPECMADPQLEHREHFVPAVHAGVGEFIVEGTRFKLSRTPARATRAVPALGEHNAEVLADILGYDADRMADVFASLAMD